LHVGHLELFRAAKKFATRLLVIVNSDHWLNKKKGYFFQNESQRVDLISSLAIVDEVVVAKEDYEGTVAPTLREIKPNFFVNASDAKDCEAELNACEEVGCQYVRVYHRHEGIHGHQLVEKIKCLPGSRS
jgi:cytidyltransferase-like protein